jgi:beta-lactamase superfamily II metal-dependent hydrolase
VTLQHEVEAQPGVAARRRHDAGRGGGGLHVQHGTADGEWVYIQAPHARSTSVLDREGVKMRAYLPLLFAFLLSLVATPARAQPRGSFEMYVVDVEGGTATLYVTPSRQSVLIDTGNGGAAGARDALRIAAAVKDAGVNEIDYLITSHWHGDHYGGMAELASRVPIRTFVDHGPNVQPSPAADEFLQQVYPKLLVGAKHLVVKAGDKIPIPGLDWRIVTSAGEVIKTPLPGRGALNPSCASFVPQDVDRSENAQSVASVVSFGRFRVAHLADLTWNKEFELMCPRNPIGTVDLNMVSHHGQPNSNAAVLVHAIQARVAIMNNGTRKGGQPEAMKIVYSAPGLEDLWQVHFSQLSGQEYSTPGVFIANLIDDQPATTPIAPLPPPSGAGVPPPPVHNGQAYWIKVSAETDGTFTVTNARNGFSKTYKPRAAAGKN